MWNRNRMARSSSASSSDLSRETTCGIGPYRPSYLQRLASKKVYMFFYGTLGIIQGMSYTYLSSTLTTMERKFGIKAKELAYLMSGNEISQFLFLFALPFMIRVKKRPMWTAVGLTVSAVGNLMMAMPHLFGTGQVYEFDADEAARMSDKALMATAGLCNSTYHPGSLDGSCGEDGGRNVDWAGLLLVFFGVVLTGVGNCCYYMFGVPYLDDNTKHENAPFMLGAVYTFRLLGPTLGYMLGSASLKMYVNPGVEVDFNEKDPRWIGAWWFGYPIIGGLILVFAIPLVCFPQRLPKQNTDAARRHEKQSLNPDSSGDDFQKVIKGFSAAIMRLVRNKLFMCNFFSNLFFVFAFMGFGTFMPKYMEFQFRMTASRSSSVTGLVGTGSKALGLLLSGWAIAKWRPSARFLAGYNVFLEFILLGVLIFFSQTGCATDRIYGEVNEHGLINVDVPCNTEFGNCDCPMERMQPVCSKDGVTNFFSPCRAGCRKRTEFKPQLNPYMSSAELKKASEPTKVFEECSCVEEAWMQSNGSGALSDEWIKNDHLTGWDYPSSDTVAAARAKLEGVPVTGAEEGWCDIDCSHVFKTFMISMGLITIVLSTGRIGNAMVALRCVAVEDKSLSMAFNVVFMSLFAMLPAPIVYGAIIDNTCILWQSECGATTNCIVYSTVALRQVLMFTTAGIMFFGVILDIGSWYYSKGLVIFYESKNESEEDIVEANGDVLLEKKFASSTLSLNNKEGHMALASHGVT